MRRTNAFEGHHVKFHEGPLRDEGAYVDVAPDTVWYIDEGITDTANFGQLDHLFRSRATIHEYSAEGEAGGIIHYMWQGTREEIILIPDSRDERLVDLEKGPT